MIITRTTELHKAKNMSNLFNAGGPHSSRAPPRGRTIRYMHSERGTDIIFPCPYFFQPISNHLAPTHSILKHGKNNNTAKTRICGVNRHNL